MALILIFFLYGCSCGTNLIQAPENVRALALNDAKYYLGMPYVYGGGDTTGPRHIASVGEIDCSGLIVNTYKYATLHLGYKLTFSDATVETLYQNDTTIIDAPSPGDLIFMSEDSIISHVALFERQVNGIVYFIDAYSLDGKVEERNYLATDPKIKCFGRINVYAY